jgi:hypothetical protein
LIFDSRHAALAWPELDKVIIGLALDVDADDTRTRFSDENYLEKNPVPGAKMVWEVLGHLMLGLSLAFATSAQRDNTIHASERALQGFCAFHHMLLAYAARPRLGAEMQRLAKTEVEAYIENPEKRVKSVVPNHGVWLAKVLLSGKSWRDLVGPYMIESFTRNVRWQVQVHPQLSVQAATRRTRRLQWCATV